MRNTTVLLLSMACGGVALGSACGGDAAVHETTETTTAPARGGEEPAEGEATATPTTERGEAPPLADLHVEDHLTYLVRRGDGDEEEAHLRVARIVERGGSRAVKLNPVGVPPEAGHPFIAWIVANEDGLVGLEPHVALGEPGFVPIDEQGALVTEAESNVAWRVPAEWLALETRAFQTDPIEDWNLVNASARIEGPVRLEHCVDLERREGDQASRHLEICRNVGIVGISVTPSQLEESETWRLVDLGPAPGELTRSLAAPAPEPAGDLEEDEDDEPSDG
jgi:hypothetical protein